MHMDKRIKLLERGKKGQRLVVATQCLDERDQYTLASGEKLSLGEIRERLEPNDLLLRVVWEDWGATLKDSL